MANDIRILGRSVEAVTHEADGLWQNEQTSWKGSRDEVNERRSDKMKKERKKKGLSGRPKIKSERSEEAKEKMKQSGIK